MKLIAKLSQIVRKLTGRFPETKEEKEKTPLGMKKCPRCRSLVMRTALRCISCGYFFGPPIQ